MIVGAGPSLRYFTGVGWNPTERLVAMILPRAGETVWWFEEGRYEQTFYGHHGGASADEMLIPLITLPMG